MAHDTVPEPTPTREQLHRALDTVLDSQDEDAQRAVLFVLRIAADNLLPDPGKAGAA